MQALKKSDSIFSVAQVVSNVGSPPVVGLLAVIVSIAAVPTAQQMRWGLIYIAVAILLPVAYVFELVRRGKVTDFHLNTRSERFGPFIVTIGAGIIAWLLIMQQNLSEVLQAVALINVLQTSMLCLITTQWKISIHGTAISGLAVLTYAIVGSIAILVVLCIPLVGWSRVYMKRHTLLQVVAGTLLGAAIVYFAISFYGI